MFGCDFMIKPKYRPLQVATVKTEPTKVLHDCHWIPIAEILECWMDTGRWWAGEHEKRFYRLQLVDGGVWEIFKDMVTGEWFVYKVHD